MVFCHHQCYSNVFSPLSPNPKHPTNPNKTLKFKTFGRSTSHLGMSFWNLIGLPTLFLNNYCGLKLDKTLKMFVLDQTTLTFEKLLKTLNHFDCKIIHFFEHVYLFFDLNIYICKYTKLHDKNPVFLTCLLHTIYTLLNYHSIEFMWEAHFDKMIGWHVLELGFKCIFQLDLESKHYFKQTKASGLQSQQQCQDLWKVLATLKIDCHESTTQTNLLIEKPSLITFILHMSNCFGVVEQLHDVNKNMHIIFEIQNFKSQNMYRWPNQKRIEM
jgi:hypothetical protein